jgi:hypothetical protein
MPEKEKEKVKPSNKKTEVISWDEFIKEEKEEPGDTKLSEKEKIDKILGINQPIPKQQTKTKSEKKKIEASKEAVPEKKLSLFKQRMLAKRNGKKN